MNCNQCRKYRSQIAELDYTVKELTERLNKNVMDYHAQGRELAELEEKKDLGVLGGICFAQKMKIAELEKELSGARSGEAFEYNVRVIVERNLAVLKASEAWVIQELGKIINYEEDIVTQAELVAELTTHEHGKE